MAIPIDDFTVVKRRVRRRNKYHSRCGDHIDTNHEMHFDPEAVKTKVHIAKNDLECSHFYKDFQDAWIQSREGAAKAKYTIHLSKTSAETTGGILGAERGEQHEACSCLINNLRDTRNKHICSNNIPVDSTCQTACNNCTCTHCSQCSSHQTQDCENSDVSSALSQVNLEHSCTVAHLTAGNVICSNCGLSFSNSTCGNVDKKLICYGLGKYSSCVTSRYQLGLLLLLQEHLKIDPDNCFIYDPVFSELEKQIIHDLGFQLIQENEESKHHCCSCTDTVFYMPHCGKAMYNNLIWANWSLQSLSRIVIIGNSFHTMVDSMLERHASTEIMYIFKLYHYVNEIPVKNSFQYTDIFNDHSIHTFPEDTLTTIPDELWAQCDEPVYSGNQHEEIIRKMTA